jgi:hypothetical protein
MLLQPRLGTTEPHTAKSGSASVRSLPIIACATGTDSATASWAASAPSILEKGVRRPQAK